MAIVEYQFIQPTKCKEIVQYTIPYSQGFDASSIEDRGDVILILKCLDGIVVVLREPESRKRVLYGCPLEKPK